MDDPPAPAPAEAWPFWKRGCWALGQALLVFGIVYLALGGRARDWHVPLDYSEDALEYLMQAQGTIENGWWWTHPHLGAPGTFEQLTYPSNTTVDQALVWLLRPIARDPGLNLNLSWLLMVALSSLVAGACLRLFDVSRLMAAAAGIAYALLPYALSRNIHHFSLAIYLVPIPCAAALAVATGRRLTRSTWTALVVGNVLLGLDYTYYAFFGCFLLVVASGIAFARDRRARLWQPGAVCLGAIVLATAVNLAPSLHAWAVEGRPLAIPDKTAAESETYGLKVRQLISPVPDHPFPLFARWATLERRAAFPLETENTTARLGLLASLGFLSLLGWLIVPAWRRLGDADLWNGAAGLTLALVLLATIGGFGSLFSLFVSAEIRAYDRVCPFIAFFAWVVIARLLSRVNPPAPLWRVVLATAVVAVALWDQAGALAPANRAYAATETEWQSLNTVVGTLEHRLPAGAMAFELPLTTYLNDTGTGRMQPYDQIKPYLASHTIHWSYPALDNAVVRWQHAVSRLPPPALALALQRAGFRAVLIDRAGYDDRGDALIRAWTPANGSAPILAESDRYVALDLAQVPADAAGTRLPAWPTTFSPAAVGLPGCAAPATAHIDRVGPLKAPVSGPLTLERAASYEVRGWAIDDAHQALSGDVDLLVDGQAHPTYYGVNRPDIATRAGSPIYRDSGVLAVLTARDLPPGPHRLALRVISADRTCASDVATLAVIVPGMF